MHAPLRTLQDELASALAHLDAAQTQATPQAHPEKWSIQQIAEHLILTYKSTVPILQTRLDKRSPTRAKPSLQQRIGQFFVITLRRFPGGRPAPAAVTPSLPATLQTGDELTHRIRTHLTAIDPLITQGEALFGSSRAASHSILGPLSMTQWCGFHLVHGRHHIQQILAIRRDHTF